jgi:membrane-bound lytic murein transglycosylase B
MKRRQFIMSLAASGLAWPAVGQTLPTADAFEAWVAGAEAAGRLSGISEMTLASARVGLALNPALIRPAGAASESRRVGQYVQRLILGDGPIARNKLAAFPDIYRIEQRYGVPASVQVAFWGRESGYGRDFGNLDVFSTLATLGASRSGRTDWQREYLAALTIVERRLRAREALKGSSAAALGHTQLMPSNYLKYGEDFDGDGRIDVWAASPLDALASAARHIQEVPAGQTVPQGGKAWKRGESWIVPVQLPPGFDINRIEVDETRLTPEAWEAMGIRPATGTWMAADRPRDAKLALPAGLGGPALLLFPNYDVFEAYNPSRTYALGVGLLARAIEGQPGVIWPEEAPLTFDQRAATQRALTAQGLYSNRIDGDLGASTRKAIRVWQRRNGLAADGYLTLELQSRVTGVTP